MSSNALEEISWVPQLLENLGKCQFFLKSQGRPGKIWESVETAPKLVKSQGIVLCWY